MAEEIKKGKIFIISAPSGAGKTTILKKIINEIPNLYFSVSVTTRAPRPGEVDGVDYHFISIEKVLEMFRKKELLEWAMVHGNFYGTPIKEIEDKINNGKNVIVDIDVKGFIRVKKFYPDSISIFIIPPSEEELKRRLLKRAGKTKLDKELAIRLQKAKYEMSFKELYDYVVVNDNLDEAYEKVKSIILKHINE